MSNPFTATADWTFLNEPLYRWAIFIFALGLILMAWRGVLGFIG